MAHMLATIRKAITALVTGAIGWGAVVLASDSPGVTGSEWLGLVVVVATAVGVYSVPNAVAAPIVPASLDTPPPQPVTPPNKETK